MLGSSGPKGAYPVPSCPQGPRLAEECHLCSQHSSPAVGCSGNVLVQCSSCGWNRKPAPRSPPGQRTDPQFPWPYPWRGEWGGEDL